jgi:hypothetical protein
MMPGIDFQPSIQERPVRLTFELVDQGQGRPILAFHKLVAQKYRPKTDLESLKPMIPLHIESKPGFWARLKRRFNRGNS